MLLELFRWITRQPSEQELFKMANLTQAETGLRFTVYVSAKQHSAGPRIKVGFDGSLSFDPKNNFSVTISDTPRVVGVPEALVLKRISRSDLDDVFDWVLLNKKPLLDYWDNKLSTKQLLDTLKGL